MECNGMNETPERNGDAVNEPTASTWPSRMLHALFFSAPLKWVVGCVAVRWGADVGRHCAAT